MNGTTVTTIVIGSLKVTVVHIRKCIMIYESRISRWKHVKDLRIKIYKIIHLNMHNLRFYKKKTASKATVKSCRQKPSAGLLEFFYLPRKYL